MCKNVSVKSKLRNAFIGIAAFSVVSAIVGVFSYQAVSDAQREVIEIALPATRNIEQLVQEGNAVQDFVPFLLSATTMHELTERRRRLLEYEDSMRSHLSPLSSLLSTDSQVGKFDVTISQIFEALQKQSDLIERRIELVELRDQQANRVLIAGRKILDVLRPAITESNTTAFKAIDEIRSQLDSRESTKSRIKVRFNQLVDSDLKSVQLLASIRFEASYLIDVIEAFLLSRSLNTGVDLRDQINISVRTLARMTAEVSDSSLQAHIGANLKVVSREVRGNSSMLANHLNINKTNERLATLSSQSRIAIEDLGQLDEELKNSIDSAIEDAIAKAENALWYGRASLIEIALAAFVSAILVVWRYVMSDVVARIDRIARVTRQYAKGDLKGDLEIKENDELGDIAGAIQLFKLNALELRRSNADLEKFAYVASHDLKAPLRGIANLAEWIEEDIGDNMPPESQRHLTLLKSRIERLSALLEGLLSYSRAGRHKSEMQDVSIGDVVSDIFSMIVAEQKFELKLPKRLPTINTAAVPFEQVIGNLFSNAIKHHDKPKGMIMVDCVRHHDRLEFKVTDDGPGIEPKYQDRVFGIFQTIKSRDEVEGSGIGLSIVKRVLESVDCTIWIESNPAQRRGSIIHFTWPVVWPSSLMDSEHGS